MAQFVPAEPFDLVIFGGTGDLSQRKLLPAIWRSNISMTGTTWLSTAKEARTG